MTFTHVVHTKASFAAQAFLVKALRATTKSSPPTCSAKHILEIELETAHFSLLLSLVLKFCKSVNSVNDGFVP